MTDRTVPRATHVTIHLARLDHDRVLPPEAQIAAGGSPLFWLAGVDEDRADSELFSRVGSEFVGFGLHEDEASARVCAEAPLTWCADAVESWSAVFVPTRTIPGCNWIEANASLSLSPARPGPVAVLTTAGWDVGPGFDIDRALRFADAVGRVRDDLLQRDIDGLHSHQLFAFPGILVSDGVTLTFWRDEAAMKEFAYRPGTHKTELDSFRLDETSDRTSFTRLAPVWSQGTWWGTNPFPMS